MTHVRNHLLASLPPAVVDEFAPRLRPIQFVQEHALYRAGDRVTQVFFPDSGLISYLVPADHHRIETAMVGHESVVGIAAALADPVALNTAMVQMHGQGHALDASVLRAAAEEHPDLRATLLRHHEAVFVQVQQAVVCNIAHTVEQRLARWLLRAHDMTGRTTLELTQEFLADMLGVRRASVSQVAHTLQNAGLITYRRGQIRILDLEGLRHTACECYRLIKRHYDRLMKPAPVVL
jgi:CRP-like cAMP-binding protein